MVQLYFKNVDTIKVPVYTKLSVSLLFFPRFWKCCYRQTLSSKGSIQRRGGGLEQSVLHVSRDTGRADSLRIINRTSITGSRYRAGQPGQHVLCNITKFILVYLGEISNIPEHRPYLGVDQHDQQ